MGPALERKIAVVTGAGAGIGQASALLFGAEGAAVVVNDQDAETAEATAAAIRESGGRAVAQVGDVSRRATVEACVDMALSEWGQLDVMLNNAATAISGYVHDLSDADWRREQEIVLDSVFYGVQCAIRAMRERGTGSIVNMSSGAAFGGAFNLGAYGANKAAVLSLTATAAEEVAHLGIRVNAITPGPTATAVMKEWAAKHPNGEAGFARAAMLRRMSRPEEIAQVALFLASDASSAVSGHTLQANTRTVSDRSVLDDF